jgi:protein CpxP
MDNQTQAPRSQIKRLRRFALAGLSAAAAVAVFALTPAGSAFARPGHGGCGGPMDMPMMGMGANVDPKVADARMDGMLKFMLADANATQAQRDQIASLMKAARADVAPTFQKLRDDHLKLIDLFAAPKIDRAAIEQLRAEQAQLHDTVSQRMLKAMEDAAEVLTPEQRAKLAAAHRARMERHQTQRAR